jgi:hypothetical protein
LKRLLVVARISVIFILASLAIVYAGDYLYARLRLAHNTPGDPIDAISFQPTYVIAQKDGRAAIVLGAPETQQCVRSLFPHFGFAPCWYLKQASEKPQVIGGMIIFCQAFTGMAGGSRASWQPVFAMATAKCPTRRPRPR